MASKLSYQIGGAINVGTWYLSVSTYAAWNQKVEITSDNGFKEIYQGAGEGSSLALHRRLKPGKYEIEYEYYHNGSWKKGSLREDKLSKDKILLSGDDGAGDGDFNDVIIQFSLQTRPSVLGPTTEPGFIER